MFKFRKAILSAAALAAMAWGGAQAAGAYEGIGRKATEKEIAAWDIDVRPDFKGLPKGSGTVDKGQEIWEAKCASCHGYFGESGEVFSPIIGGVTPKDIETGNVANLRDTSYPGRTTFMKVATVSTIFDFIQRAMPWDNPKSLSPDDVYSVLSFMLNLSGIIPENFVLNQDTIKEVQKRMPNRNGMTREHNMWPGTEFSKVKTFDVKNTACMKNCVVDVKVDSFLPDFARNAHGNLAEQVRMVGAAAGADTTKPELKVGDKPVKPAAPPAEKPGAAVDLSKVDFKTANAAMNKNGCLVCHGLDKKIVGPAYSDVAKKHAGKMDYLLSKIKAGGVGVWGEIPMPPQNISDKDAQIIAAWLAAGGKK